MEIMNLTPHGVTILRDSGESIILPPEVQAARVSVETQREGDLYGIPLSKSVFGEVQNLPEAKIGVYYVVSAIVAQACPGRADLLIVNETVRGQDGSIVGCRSLAKNPWCNREGSQ